MRKVLILTTALLTGCASTASETMLTSLKQSCVMGHAEACAMVPQQEYLNAQEANRNGLLVVSAVLLGVAAGLGASAGGGGHHYHHRGW